MVTSSVKRQILSDLERLSPEQQRRAADLIRDLAAERQPGTSGRDLLRFAGTVDGESARQMLEAIEAGCERVDVGEW